MKTNKIKEDCGSKQNSFNHRNEKRIGKKKKAYRGYFKKYFTRDYRQIHNLVDKAKQKRLYRN